MDGIAENVTHSDLVGYMAAEAVGIRWRRGVAAALHKRFHGRIRQLAGANLVSGREHACWRGASNGPGSAGHEVLITHIAAREPALRY